jgi:hypothetical protein
MMEPQLESKNWLQRLLEEIESFDPEMFPPTNEAEEGERVLGICPEFMKKIFCLARLCEREAKQTKLDAEFSSESEGMRAHYEEMHDKYKFLMALFWMVGQTHFHSWGLQETLGVRKGWEFVVSKDKPPDITKILRGFQIDL